MWFTRQADGFQAFFTITTFFGALRTGASSGQFVATVIDPADTTSINPTVTETTNAPGLYTFLIPSAFITTNGIGNYGVLVDVSVLTTPFVNDAISGVLKVSVNDFDSISTGSAAAVWDVVPTTPVAGSFGEITIATRDSTIIATGLTVVGSTALVLKTDILAALDYYNGMLIQVIDGVNVLTRVIDVQQADGTITLVDTLPFTPGIGAVIRVLSPHNSQQGSAG